MTNHCTLTPPFHMLGKDFPSLARRVLYSYIAAYPKFVPVDGIDTESDRQMHDFLYNLCRNIYESPDIIGVDDTTPDGCYESWELNNSNPELIDAMTKVEYKLASFVEVFIKTGLYGTASFGALTIPKSEHSVSAVTAQKLTAAGLTVTREKGDTVISSETYPLMFAAWRAYSAADDAKAQKIARMLSFLHGKYYGRLYTAADYFMPLMSGDENTYLKRLEDFFSDEGFTLLNYNPSSKTRFAYVRYSKEYPGKESAYMNVYFDWRKRNQFVYEFRLPGFRTIFDNFESLDDDLKDMVFDRLKTCDGCGYCTQTDKSGNRPRLCRPIEYSGDTVLKCPLYLRFAFRKMSCADIDAVLKLFKTAINNM